MGVAVGSGVLVAVGVGNGVSVGVGVAVTIMGAGVSLLTPAQPARAMITVASAANINLFLIVPPE